MFTHDCGLIRFLHPAGAAPRTFHVSAPFYSLYVFLCWVFTVQPFLLQTTKNCSLWSSRWSAFLKIMLPFALLERLFPAILGILVFMTLNFHSLPFPVKQREVRGGTRTLIWFSVWSDCSESFYVWKKKKKKHLRLFCHNSNICNYLLFTAKTHFLQISNSANYSDASRLKVFNISCLK